MILHDVRYANFDIRLEDTLEHPQHRDLRFDAIVANPPFSAKWEPDKAQVENDDRFSVYGKLAPSSKADLAFVELSKILIDLSNTGLFLRLFWV